jgi:hypothetical protein
MRAALAILLLCASVAHVAADDKAEAERYFRAGAKAYAAQNFAAAVADFEEAFKALPLPEIAFSAAQSYRRLYRIDPQPRHVARAVELYRIYLEKVKTGGRVGDAADNLAEMERELDKLKAKGVKIVDKPTERTRLGVTVTVADRAPEPGVLREIADATGDSSLAGVKVTIDGKAVEPFALIDVAPGDHVITVTADGYVPVEKKQRAIASATALVDVTLQPRLAKVIVDTEGGAEITLDGRPQSQRTLHVAAGAHLLAVTHRGREPFARELTVTRGQQLTIKAPLEKTAQRRAVPWLVGGATGLAAGAAVTGVIALVHNSRASDARAALDAGNALPGVGDDYDREVGSRDRYRTATFALGGAALATGAVAYILDRFDRRGPEKIQVAPSAGGAAVSGRF